VNKIIEKYFQSIELALVTHSHVTDYNVINMKIVNDTGKIRIRCQLVHHEILEFFNYIKVIDNLLIIDKYSFHWQDEVGIVKKRWDNAPHHLHLPNARHHLHIGSEIVQAMIETPDIFKVLQWITE